MGCLVTAAFSFAKTAGNKEKILALVLKLETAVKNLGGEYSDHWEDEEDNRKINIKIKLPDKQAKEEITGYLDGIEALLHETDDESDTQDPGYNGQQKCDESKRGSEMETDETVPVQYNDKTDETVQEQCSEKSQSVVSGKKQKERSKKHLCPYSNCGASVIHLPRHMRQRHQWSPRKARSVLNTFTLRRTKEASKRKTKRSYRRVVCPVDDCNSVVKRIHNHLTDVHKFKQGSARYKKWLACPMHEQRHQVSVLSETEYSELSNHSDDNDSSADSDWSLPKNMKSQSHVKQLTNVYDDVYGSNEESCEEEPTESCGESAGISNDYQDDDDAITPVELDGNQQSILNTFENWLKGADGGKRGDRSAVQCRRQVELVISYVDNSNPTINNILHKNTLRDKWLNKFDKEKKPGTVKSYLGSLNQFYSFLKCEKVDVSVSSEQLTSLSDQIKLWTKSFRKESNHRFWEKRMEDMSSMRTPEQIKEFETAEIARTAIRLLGEYQESEIGSPSQPEYTLVRDYLLTLICINNGSRSGTLANMTLGEFNKGTKEDECFVVRVKDHKTFTTHGPVNIVLESVLFKYVSIFIEKFRNQLDGVSTDANAPVFMTWNNGKMKSSQVGAQIGSCWGKVFGKDTSLGGATAFRKAAVSAVHECNENMRGDLADLMVHKKSTADKYYLLKNKSKSAVQTSKELAKIMRSGGASCSTEKGDSREDEELPCDEPLSENTSPRHIWSLSETCALEFAFSSHIKQKAIRLEEVREIVKSIPPLQSIPAKKIRDKVRSYFGKDDSLIEDSLSLPKEILSLPKEIESKEERLKRAGLKRKRDTKQTSQNELIAEEIDSHSLDEIFSEERDNADENGGDGDDDEYAPSVQTTKRTSQSLLTMEEDRLFNQTFSKLIHSTKTISMKTVVKTVQKDPKLSHLLKTMTHRQLADRVRSERKAIVRADQRKELQKKAKK